MTVNLKNGVEGGLVGSAGQDGKAGGVGVEGMRAPVFGKGRQVQRVLILGGGFGGVYTAYHLEKIFKGHAGVEITLVAKDNYFVMTPLLFEAGSGVLEPRHAVQPIRPLFKKVRFVEADVESVDLENRRVYARHSLWAKEEPPYALEYDQLVLALGGETNVKLIPGSEHAFGFKTLRDAIFMRNHIIDLFEQADVERDGDRRKELLTFVVIGAGLVGVELVGEFTEFTDNLLRTYTRVRKEEVRFVLVEATDKVLPEMERDLAEYAAQVLWKRGVDIRTSTRVLKIEPKRVYLPGDEVIASETIVLAAGVAVNTLIAGLGLEKNRAGKVVTAGTMRSVSHAEVWALGDAAAIPDPKGKLYPPLAQHALREAKVLAKNIAAVIEKGEGAELKPFVYETMGTLASLGHYDGVGRVGPIKLKGFAAWWAWRTYYVMQMPRWERRLRIILDWTIALLFRNDVVKLDLFGEEHPVRRRGEDEARRHEEAKREEIGVGGER